MNAHRRTATVLLVGVAVVYLAALALSLSMLLVRDPAGCACARDVQAAHSASLGRWLGGIAFGALLGIGIGVAAATARSVARSVETLRRTRLGRRTLGSTRVQIVPGPGLRAFCVGGWRASTVVTPHFLQLSGGEQRAVLAHEQAHARARDPLAFAAFDQLARLVPVLRPLGAEFRRQAEFAADDAARGVAGDAAFAAALATGLGEAPGGTAAFSPTEARIRRFLGRPYAAPRTPIVGAGVCLALVLAILAFGFSITRTAVAHETLWCTSGPVWCRGEAPLRSEDSGSAPRILCRSTPGGTVCVLR